MFITKALCGLKTIPNGVVPLSSPCKKPAVMRLSCLAVFGVALLLVAGVSSSLGDSLNLKAQPPDISAGFLTTTYDATTGLFTASGFPVSFNISGNSTPDYPSISSGQYQLIAQVTPAGQPVSGSLNITGTIPGLTSSGTLLTGTLSQFGFQNAGGDIFEFIYHVTGGDLASYYHGQTGIILDATNSGFKGSFTTNFAASPFLGISDNVMLVPEASSMLLLLGAVAFGVPIWGIRRSRRSADHA
jgi:hypothetical protein